MGSWFSNIHIRRGEGVSMDTVRSSIENMMRRKEYELTAAENAETEVIIADSESSEWFSVYCEDVFDFEEGKEFYAIAKLVSAELKTDVLGIRCADSDYLEMNLINASEKVKACASVGDDGWMGKIKNFRLSAWKNKVRDFREFKKCFKGERLFAEDVLGEMEAHLCLPQAFSTAYSEDFEDDPSVLRLHFKLKEAQQLTQEKPSFIMHGGPIIPCSLEQSTIISFLNMGGASKGLSVFFIGPYVEHEEITFSDVHFAFREPNRETIRREPFELEKVRLADGRWAYCHHAPEMIIPQKVAERLPLKRKMSLESMKEISIGFTPHGNKRKLLDITLVVVPDGNPEGQSSWNVWSGYKSKEDYIKMYNSRFASDVRQEIKTEDFD